jgi:hypothetical protein
LEAEKIHALATQIVFAIADCGPLSISNIGGKKTESTKLNGFQVTKARDIIRDKIEDFILKGF